MPSDVEIIETTNKLIESYDNMAEKVDKALNRKLNTVFAFIMRLASIILFAAAIFAGIQGFGGSAFVLGSMFLIFWISDRISVAVVGGFKNYADAKTRELELEKEKVLHRSR